jgi:hypothetical protein
MENFDARALINAIDTGMDILLSVICVIGLVGAVLSYTRSRIRKDGFAKGMYLGVLAGIEAIVLILIIYFIPLLLERVLPNIVRASSIRWLLLYVFLVPLWYFVTRRDSGTRGLYFLLILLTTFLLGWQYYHWIGVVFISVPIALIFFHVIDRLAQVVIPASDPEDKSERWQKTLAFLMYMLGIQYPFRVASKKTSRELDIRVTGNPTNDFGKPGIAWVWPHQVVGLSKGVEFNKVSGPGTIFTGQYEAPIALVDLRTQIRVSTIDAITKDGMKVPAVIFMAFAIDKEKWPKEGWPRALSARIKHLYPDSLELDHVRGSYPYSSNRVRSVLSTIGIDTALQDSEKPEFYWDEWVIKQIEHAAREILSERGLDELWRPQNDGPGFSALDEMALALKKLVAPKLTEVGVNLFTARIVNYQFEEDGQVAKQNIKTWGTYWQQQVIEAEADAEAIYREEIEKAHAFSKSVLLDAIAESMNAARTISEKLPRHVIAQYYVHSLEEYIKKQPGLDIAESKKRLEDVKNFLLYSQSEGNE